MAVMVQPHLDMLTPLLSTTKLLISRLCYGALDCGLSSKAHLGTNPQSMECARNAGQRICNEIDYGPRDYRCAKQ